MYSKYILVVASCAIACAFARPSDVPSEQLQPEVIPILSQSEELEPNGTYKFSYETGNGIKREEIAYEKVVPKSRSAGSNEGDENDAESDEIHVQRGSYSYTAPDGTLITLRYIADENGFQPIGDHLPRAPVLSYALSTPVEKSGRALKLADNTESASVPVEAKTVEKVSEPIEEVKIAPLPVNEEPEIPSSEAEKLSTEPEATEATEETNVDVSTEVASTAAPALPTTGSEQASDASAELTTTAPEQVVLDDVTESASSTSASEESSPSEADGQSTDTNTTNESPAEEIQQESTSAPESAPVEEAISTIPPA